MTEPEDQPMTERDRRILRGILRFVRWVPLVLVAICSYGLVAALTSESLFRLSPFMVWFFAATFAFMGIVGVVSFFGLWSATREALQRTEAVKPDEPVR